MFWDEKKLNLVPVKTFLKNFAKIITAFKTGFTVLRTVSQSQNGLVGKLSPVSKTSVTNVTTHAVVFSQRQTSHHHHLHQRQTSNNDKRHRVFYSRTTNVTNTTSQLQTL